jgi:NAD(P)-dependent dehydrogenase (short-subunit alcohol dehydrogenase family)
MDLGLKGKVALITGAGSQKGFGKGITLTLAREGCDIIVSDINLQNVELTAMEVKALGRRVLALQADVRNRDQVNEMVKRGLEYFGKIDILVNNAGIGTHPRPFVESLEEDWDLGINSNLKGTMYCTKAVLPHMLESKQGKIINISSVAGLVGVPKGSVYGAAKAGIVNFTAALALEVADCGVNVNCIAPGLGNTNFLAACDFPADYIKHTEELDAAGKTITP